MVVCPFASTVAVVVNICRHAKIIHSITRHILVAFNMKMRYALQTVFILHGTKT